MAERILIIDDDVDTLKLVGLMLQKKGFEILAANNGQQGVREAIKQRPDLILLDVMMPGMDGYQVAKLLRQNPETAHIPILMFTAKSQLDDKVSGFEAGADDYLTKPTHPAELYAHVKALLARSAGQKEGSAEPRKQAVLIGVLGARGGIGVTTVGVNLAGILTHETKKQVAFVELQPGRGMMSLDLGLKGVHLLDKLLDEDPLQITTDKVNAEMIEHNSGVRLLLASWQPLAVARLWQSAVQLKTVVERLRAQMDYVVLDLGTCLTPFILEMFKLCDQGVIVVEPVQSSVIQSRALIADLQRADMEPGSLYYVVNNRERSEIKLSWMTVQELLGQKIFVNIMPAPELVFQARRQKILPMQVNRSHLFNQQLQKLAAALTANNA